MHLAAKNHLLQVCPRQSRATYQATPPAKTPFPASGGRICCALQTSSCDLVELSWYQWHPGVTLSVCNYCVCPRLMCQYIRDSQIFTPLIVSVSFTSPTPNPSPPTKITTIREPLGPNMLVVFRDPAALGAMQLGSAKQFFGEAAITDSNLPANYPQPVRFALVQSAHLCWCFSICVTSCLVRP